MRKNILSAMLISAALTMSAPTGAMFTSYAATQSLETAVTAETEDDTDLIKDAERTDENGNITISVYLKDDTVTPLNITLTKDDMDYTFTVNNSGDPLKIKPGTYSVKKVVDGNGKKLDSGAKLSIDDDSEGVYLDFTNPNKSGMTTMTRFLIRNIMFIPFCALCVFVVRKVVSHVEA